MIHDKDKVFGMLPYVAPELFNFKSKFPPFSKKTDIYSLGVLLWELSSGYPPFGNRAEIGVIFNIINGTREKKILNTPSDYYDLYTACWNENPVKRPIIEDAYNKLKNMTKCNEIVDTIEGIFLNFTLYF